MAKVTAEQKRAMLEAELKGQPEIAADDDHGAGAGLSLKVAETGAFESVLAKAAESPAVVDVQRPAEIDEGLDKQIHDAEKRLRSLKVRRAVGPGQRKLKPGQEVIVKDDGRVYIREVLKGEKSTGEIVRDTCIEYEPN